MRQPKPSDSCKQTMADYSFTGNIPDDRRYCRQYDMWVKHEAGGIFIGATRFGLHLAGEIIAFTAKPNGAHIGRGKGLGVVECRKTVLAVHAPISLYLKQGNENAEERPALINADPYGAGWLAFGEALDWEADNTALCDAEEYKKHILSIDRGARLDD